VQNRDAVGKVVKCLATCGYPDGSVRKNCNISAIICPISIKFGTMMQNMSLEFMAVKNSAAKNHASRQPPS